MRSCLFTESWSIVHVTQFEFRNILLKNSAPTVQLSWPAPCEPSWRSEATFLVSSIPTTWPVAMDWWFMVPWHASTTCLILQMLHFTFQSCRMSQGIAHGLTWILILPIYLRQFLCCFHDYVHTSGRLGRSIDPWVEKDGRVANCSPVWKFPDISQADCFGLLSFRWQCTETKNKHLQSSRSCATWHCWRHSTSLILTLNTKGWKQSSDLMKASMSQTMTSTASRFELVVFCRMFLANLIPWLAAGGQVCKKLGALQEDSSVCRNAFSCILVHRIWPRVFWLQDVSQLLETWNWLIQSD